MKSPGLNFIIVCVAITSAFFNVDGLRLHPKIRISTILKASTAPSTSSSTPTQTTELDLFSKIQKFFQIGSSSQKAIAPPVTESYEREISEAKRFLLRAANRELDKEDSDKIVSTLMELEKLMRKQNKADDGLTGKETLERLNGAWRLIFTTGSCYDST